MKIRYVGICDVCGDTIKLEHDMETDGVIDYAYDEGDRLYTWIRHLDGKNQDCQRYSSRVYKEEE